MSSHIRHGMAGFLGAGLLGALIAGCASPRAAGEPSSTKPGAAAPASAQEPGAPQASNAPAPAPEGKAAQKCSERAFAVNCNSRIFVHDPCCYETGGPRPESVYFPTD